jgi:hypothetical protein
MIAITSEKKLNGNHAKITVHHANSRLRQGSNHVKHTFNKANDIKDGMKNAFIFLLKSKL